MESTLAKGAHVPGTPSHPVTYAEEFGSWVDPHLPAMNRLAAILVSDADREDVVQEALLRAWKRRTTFDPARGTAAAWLLAIVRDQARRRRTRGSNVGTVQLAATQAVADPERDVDLERAVASLPKRQRLAVELHYYVGLDVATCAALMSCAEGTVKATLHQARRRLHQQLGEQEEK